MLRGFLARDQNVWPEGSPRRSIPNMSCNEWPLLCRNGECIEFVSWRNLMALHFCDVAHLWFRPASSWKNLFSSALDSMELPKLVGKLDILVSVSTWSTSRCLHNRKNANMEVHVCYPCRVPDKLDTGPTVPENPCKKIQEPSRRLLLRRQTRSVTMCQKNRSCPMKPMSSSKPSTSKRNLFSFWESFLRNLKNSNAHSSFRKTIGSGLNEIGRIRTLSTLPFTAI